MASSSALITHPGPGCVVEFMQGNRPQLAWVLEEQSGRLRLLTQNKRETKLAAARLLPWSGPQHGPEASRQDMLDALEAHRVRREELEGQVDAMEIWELSQGEVDRARAQWFAELIWEGPDVDRVAAMGRALLECKTHFKFHPPDFDIYDADKVEQRRVEQEAAREREAIVTGGQEFFQALWKARQSRSRPPAPPEDQAVAQRLARLLRQCMADPDQPEAAPLWRQLSKGLPENPHLPLLLAQAWGLVEEHHNFWLDRAGFEPGDTWWEPCRDEVERLLDAARTPSGDLDPHPFVSVDSETTRDLDDAFYVEPGQDGGYRLRLALAMPVLAWDFDSSLDKAVAARATSLYLPEGDCHMLPEVLSTDAYSLVQGEPRPALFLDMALDADGKLRSCDPRAGWARVAANLSYRQVEDCLALGRGDTPAEPHRASLALGLDLARKLRGRRVADGAVAIDRPDPEVTLAGRGADAVVSIELKEPCPEAQLLVSEFMILANAALAQWARERGVAMLYRTQDIAVPEGYSGAWSEPHEIFQVVKALGSSILEPDPKPHASLGVPAYCPATSPLRRRTDLVNQAQVVHYLEADRPRWTRDELAGSLPNLSARLEAVSQAQRFRPRYWKLLWFRQQGEQALHDAVAVDETDYHVTVALPREQILVRERRQSFGDKVYLGQRFRVRVGKVDPLNNEIRILEALES